MKRAFEHDDFLDDEEELADWTEPEKVKFNDQPLSPLKMEPLKNLQDMTYN